ncbi:MAG: RIP metalloprotease RseP [Mariprofundaceae bacterium]|nr:RIP metalloprotease RseP [Mariprofundaceae bacterium]
MMETVHTVLAFIFAIAVLVTVHEYGHFIVARKLGIRVEKFSIGFGPAIFSWRGKDGEVEYVIAAIPLGGYVKMLGENLDEQGERQLEGQGEQLSETELARAYHVQAVWKRASVAAAGPIFNFIFAIVAYMMVAWLGQNVMPPIVGNVLPGSVAERAGLMAGDVLKSVNGNGVVSWQQFEESLKETVGKEVDIVYTRQDMPVSVTMPVKEFEQDALLVNVSEDGLGLGLGTLVFIDSVIPSSPADRAGLMPGDQIIQIEGKDVATVRALIRSIQQHAGKPLTLGVLRADTYLQLSVVPKAGADPGVGRMGVHLMAKPLSDPIIYRMGLWEGVAYGFTRTVEMTVLTVQVLGKMITSAISPDNLGGPIAIAQLAGRTADLGLAAFITFLALISVNLGVLNFLPIPILDGGHLVYLTLEKLRGKPLSVMMMERMQLLGMLLIAALMTFAFYNDLMRLFRG